eukprot:TRINITY_DN17792_c0_g1_i1.p1 TRINITY_DN17792_c0_g1~~TRINITY_DN17792_c0_g1_i1.p1  ORF type:complete len:228 (+),score=49.92 TRINITY_DN17792_c0_g1_i1:229-912(+)
MYFIVRGKVAILDNDTMIEIIEEGKFFGETSLLLGIVSFATIKSVTHVDCFSLSRSNFEEVLSKFPNQKDEIISNAKLKITQNKLKSLLLSNIAMETSAVSSFVDLFRPVFLEKDEILYNKDSFVTSVFLMCEGSFHLKFQNFFTSNLKELNIFGNVKQNPKGVNGYIATSKSQSMLLEITWSSLVNFYKTYQTSAESVWQVFLEEFSYDSKRDTVFRRSMTIFFKV